MFHLFNSQVMYRDLKDCIKAAKTVAQSLDRPVKVCQHGLVIATVWPKE